MTDEFGHHASIGAGVCIDSWGTGPFMIEVGGKQYRFDDSDRFGPLLLTRAGTPAANQPGDRSPFWKGYMPWLQQGRRVAEDGITCIFEPLRPTIARRLRGRNVELIEEGDEGGGIIVLEDSNP